jgi:four helix bundle protein
MGRSIETFEDLEVWKWCAGIRRDIAELVKSFPVEERFRLSDQMLRASRSATANIAEAFGRFHYQESVQFCRQARGSLYELIDHLHVAKEEGHLPEESFEKHRKNILTAVRLMNGFIRYLSGRNLAKRQMLAE